MAGSCLIRAIMQARQPAAGCGRGLAFWLPVLEVKNRCACTGSSSVGSSARENYCLGERKGGEPGRASPKRCDGVLV